MTRMLTPGGVSVAAIRQQMERQRYEARHTPRMIFAMDATGSREPSWEMAGKLHREMGAALGSLTLQMIFFGGTECKASKWVVGGQRLAELMIKVRCATGYTQIGRVLQHVLTESREHTIRALVYVGDCCEESGEELFGPAEQLKRQKIPIFVFHEGTDSVAEPHFPAPGAGYGWHLRIFRRRLGRAVAQAARRRCGLCGRPVQIDW